MELGAGTGARLLVGLKAASSDRLGRELQNGACQHNCPHGRMSSPNDCHQYLCPQGNPRCLLPL